MDNPENSLIVASRRDLPTFAMNEIAIQAKFAALSQSALIAKVTDRDSKIIAVRAQGELKKCFSSFEKNRVELTEPLLIAQRTLKKMVDLEKLPLEQEYERITKIVSAFDEEERCRILEEERAQRRELERIEAEKQAEIKRIADEQAAREAEARRVIEAQEAEARRIKAETDRVAREELEAAEKLAREATNKNEREAAEKARVEAEDRAAAAKIESNKSEAAAKVEHERVEAALREQAATAQAQTAAIEEKAGDAAYVAAKPIEAVQIAGQRKSSNWNIVVEQPFVLAKYHPDLVDIKPRLGDIKQRLNEGIEVKGIKATREYVSGVIAKKTPKAIEV